MNGPRPGNGDAAQAKEGFCFAVLDPKQCSLDKAGDPQLAYVCRALSNDGTSIEGVVCVPILITDSEGARRHKAATAIAAHFANSEARLNVSLSTVIFG